MAKTENPNKSKIIAEFETMKSFELSARDLYAQIARDSWVSQQQIKDAFARLADDEQRHADLVQQILNLLGHAL